MAARFKPLQPTLGIAHDDLRLVCGCSAMEAHFNKLPINNYCADVASRGSLEFRSECCNRGQTSSARVQCFSTWSRSMSLCGLPLRGWAVVAPRRFHIIITALTVARGNASMTDTWRTVLLERMHPMTVPRWKSLSSSVRPFYCQCLSKAIASMLYTCQQRVWLK